MFMHLLEHAYHGSFLNSEIEVLFIPTYLQPIAVCVLLIIGAFGYIVCKVLYKVLYCDPHGREAREDSNEKAEEISRKLAWVF